jgi:hypothetical protein
MASPRRLMIAVLAVALAGGSVFGLELLQSSSASAHEGEQHGGEPVKLKKEKSKQRRSKGSGKSHLGHSEGKHKHGAMHG